MKEEVKIFMNLKGARTEKLEDQKFQRDFSFFIDMTSHLNNLNFKLQGTNQPIISLLSHVKNFESIHLFIAQLKRTVLHISPN